MRVKKIDKTLKMVKEEKKRSYMIPPTPTRNSYASVFCFSQKKVNALLAINRKIDKANHSPGVFTLILKVAKIVDKFYVSVNNVGAK